MLNPAVFFNSSLWGQVDGIGALFVAASLYFLLGKRFIYSGIALGLALTFKPLFVVALPIFGLVLFFKSSKKHINIVFRYVLAVTITIWTVCFPFVLTKAFAISGLITAPFTLLYERYLASKNHLNEEYKLKAEEAERLYEYLNSKTAIRFSRKNSPIPNFEIKFPKDELDKAVFTDFIKVVVPKGELIVSSIERNIAFKRFF